MLTNFSKRNSTSFTNLNQIIQTDAKNVRTSADIGTLNLRASKYQFKSGDILTKSSTSTSGLQLISKPTIPSLEDESYDFEEQGDECVYQISYKKVYNTHLTDTNNNQITTGGNSNSGLVYTRVKIKQLRYASLNKFIEHLINQETGELDSSLVQTFLATYRTFTDTKTVLSKLKTKYSKIMPASLEMTEDVRQQYLKSLRLIFKLWLENYTEDFDEPNDYPNLNELYRVAQKYFPESNIVNLIRKKFELFKQTDMSCDSLEGSIRQSVSNINSSGSSLEEFRIQLDQDFMKIDSLYIAEQLTYLDKVYFQKICTHLCLGSVWGTRYQKIKSIKNSKSVLTPALALHIADFPSFIVPTLSEKFASFEPFIIQFNFVTYFVQSTILKKIDLKPNQRAKIISKWIEIARCCRRLKNFYSLNAIVQSLTTQCISRLEKTWNEVSTEDRSQFEQLSDIFSQDGNQKLLRDILIKDSNNYRFLIESIDPITKTSTLSKTKSNSSKDLLSILEGTSKYAEINMGINATLGRRMKENLFKQQRKQQRIEPVGTIPFLGMFLRDLEYLNAQSKKPDKNMINVQQKRKEFEIIAQLKLLQQASQLYNIKRDSQFDHWLYSQSVLNEDEYYDNSYLIQPKEEPDRNSKQKSNLSHRSDSSDSLYNSFKTPSTNKKNIIGKNFFNHSRGSSIGSSDLVDSSESPKSIVKNNMSNSSQNDSCNTSTSNDFVARPNQCTVKVKIEQDEHGKRQESEVLYKKITINDNERTKSVKENILRKFFMNPDTHDDFVLVQVLNDNSIQSNEITIDHNSNVYYALKSVDDIQLVLRKKKEFSMQMSNDSGLSVNSNRLSGLPPQCPSKTPPKTNSPNLGKFFKKILS